MRASAYNWRNEAIYFDNAGKRHGTAFAATRVDTPLLYAPTA